MSDVALQLQRLQRHYDTSVRTYDPVSLLDLSHALRMWTDLKQILSARFPAFISTRAFRSAIPAKKVMRAARGHRHVFAYMPGGVTTFASEGHLASGPAYLGPREDYAMAVAAKPNVDGSLELKNYCFVATGFDQPLIEAMRAEDVSRGNYIQWLGAEVARVSYPTENGQLVRVTLSRETTIRRVANVLDGSHPAVPAQPNHALSVEDGAVLELLNYKVGGLILPYFILLKAAQDLLDLAPSLLRRGGR